MSTGQPGVVCSGGPFATAQPNPGGAGRSGRAGRILRCLAIGTGLLALVVVLWNQGQRLIEGQTQTWASYGVVALLVFGDAVFPVLPGETTLNAASVMAANGKLDISLVILAGALGATTGDSAVYWIARRAKGRVRRWMDKATDNKNAAKVLDLLDRRGPAFLLFGRYIPGVRFALNATLGGIVRMPYSRFVRWSALSGAIWSVYTCTTAYFIGSALGGYPLMSLIIAGIASTVLITLAITAQNRIQDHVRRRRAAAEQTGATDG